MSRPFKQPLEQKRPTLNFRLPAEQKAAIEAAASAAGRSISEEVELRIARSLLADDLMRVARETIRQEMRAEFEVRFTQPERGPLEGWPAGEIKNLALQGMCEQVE